MSEKSNAVRFFKFHNFGLNSKDLVFFVTQVDFYGKKFVLDLCKIKVKFYKLKIAV